MKEFRALKLAIGFYHEAKGLSLPRPLHDQFQRALLSISLNLSEGSAKPSRKDRKRFYAIALGSFREVQTLLELSDNLEMLKMSDRLGASLYCLVKKA
jgi:four helix bundle protein